LYGLKLDDKDSDNTWFQQDGATCHTVNKTIALLHSKFPGRVISRRGGPDNWPARPRGLTSLDLFLRAYAKRKTFANNTKTIPEVQDDVRRVVVGMEPRGSCKQAMENFEKDRESESIIFREKKRPFG